MSLLPPTSDLALADLHGPQRIASKAVREAFAALAERLDAGQPLLSAAPSPSETAWPAQMALAHLAFLAGHRLTQLGVGADGWLQPARDLPAASPAPAAPVAWRIFRQARQALEQAFAATAPPTSPGALLPVIHACHPSLLDGVSGDGARVSRKWCREAMRAVLAGPRMAGQDATPPRASLELGRRLAALAPANPKGRPFSRAAFGHGLNARAGTPYPGMEDDLRQWWTLFEQLGETPNLVVFPGAPAWTPLLYCVRNNLWGLASDLVRAGADVDARTSKGNIASELFSHQAIKPTPDAPDGLEELWFALFDAGLTGDHRAWFASDPAPSIPQGSYLATIHDQWRAFRLDQQLPRPAPAPARPRM